MCGADVCVCVCVCVRGEEGGGVGVTERFSGVHIIHAQYYYSRKITDLCSKLDKVTKNSL